MSNPAKFYLDKLESLTDCDPGTGASATLDNFRQLAKDLPLWRGAMIAAGLYSDKYSDPYEWGVVFVAAVEEITAGENAEYWEETYPLAWGE
jgi:hypothetical protein